MQQCINCCGAEAQRNADIEACSTHFPKECNIVVICDIGSSGNMPFKSETEPVLPGLGFIAELIEQGLISKVCVYSYSRISISSSVALDFLKLVWANNIELFSATQPPIPTINPNDPLEIRLNVFAGILAEAAIRQACKDSNLMPIAAKEGNEDREFCEDCKSEQN